jgi:gamma-glutamyltranspeptidase/glutathione hydrolase
MKGVVVCPQPRAADVGAAILAKGGNAFDAAVATAFSQMVNDPFMCGIGGMGTLHYYENRGQTTFSGLPGDQKRGLSPISGSGMVDFYNRAGSKVRPDMWQHDLKGRTEISGYSLFDDYRSEIGYTSIMTPGTPAGFGLFHERHCSLPWAELLAPAIAQAEEGIVVTPHLAGVWTRYRQPGIPDGYTRLTKTAECARVYLHPEDRFYEVGEVMRLPDYARTLERIARGGWREFHHGALGDEIAADLEANGAYVTRADIANFEPELGAPLEGSYRGYVVRSNPPPGSGATLIEMLQILEHFELGRLDHSSARHLDLVARAMAAAHVDRNEYLGDPRFADVPAAMLISKERAAYWAEKIERGEFPGDDKQAPPSCTTHLCAMDSHGNAVTLTHTLGTASGVVTPGLGFNYNNSMKLFDPIPGRKNSIAPGKARTTGMVPTMLLKDGKPVLIAGAPGGSVIISATLQAILNVIDFGMSPVEAVTVPRIHCEGKGIQVEATVQGAVVAKLRAIGHKVVHSPHSFEPMMSRAHVISTLGGRMRGGADPRGGAGVGYAW